MHRLVHLFVKAVAAELPIQGPVVEIGSFQVEGQEEIADLRPFFPGLSYVGVDVRPGTGVDRIEDACALSFAEGSIGTVLMMETLEHISDPARALAEVRRTLRPDGLFVLSTPFALQIHEYPNDYWRFTPAAYDLMLETLGPRLTGSIGPEKDPLFVFGIAFRSGDVEQARAAGRAVVQRYTREISQDPIIARERRWNRWAQGLTMAAPFAEVRRVYRSRARSFDTRFQFIDPAGKCERA